MKKIMIKKLWLLVMLAPLPFAYSLTHFDPAIIAPQQAALKKKSKSLKKQLDAYKENPIQTIAKNAIAPTTLSALTIIMGTALFIYTKNTDDDLSTQLLISLTASTTMGFCVALAAIKAYYALQEKNMLESHLHNIKTTKAVLNMVEHYHRITPQKP